MDQPLADVDQDVPYVIVGADCDQRVEFLNPKPEQIRLKDIAYGLARSSRFQGHTPGWYSTAEHCCVGAYFCDWKNGAVEFLLHDAAEYIFSDVSAPIKVLPELAGYKALEHNFERHVFKKYLGYDKLNPKIKLIDKQICASESIVIRKRPRHTQTVEPLNIKAFFMWDWQTAYKNYLAILKFHLPGKE